VDIGVAESNISRMELMECNRSIEWLRDQGSNLGVIRVQIVTDSRYVHDNINRAVGWRRNGWRNFDNRPIENHDLWNRFISLRSSLQVLVTFHWTKGKKSPRLKLVDKAAKNAAKSGEHGVDLAFERVKLEGQEARLQVPPTSTLHEGRQKSLAHTEAWPLARVRTRFALWCSRRRSDSSLKSVTLTRRQRSALGCIAVTATESSLATSLSIL
jgi:ribonuclease HI